jgi:hypothetical protein
MENSNLAEIARRATEQLSEVSATASVNGAIIRLTQDGRVFAAECIGEDRFLAGYEEPPTSGGFPVRVISQPRVELSGANMIERANVWARVKAWRSGVAYEQTVSVAASFMRMIMSFIIYFRRTRGSGNSGGKR